MEQKISDQGPNDQRVDPHLLGLAIHELVSERKFIKSHTHSSTGSISWYANAKQSEAAVNTKLSEIAPLYAQVSSGQFPNLVGDSLEIAVFKSLRQLNDKNPQFTFFGSIELDKPKNKQNRYRKIEPPQTVSGHTTRKIPDFIINGFESGSICVECKNYREWFYPHHNEIIKLIRVGLELHSTPLLIARRIHYTTITNFLKPAGIIAHESYYQYYPVDQVELADNVRHKRSLGFSDVRASEEPDQRTIKFFTSDLKKIVDNMARRFQENRSALEDYVAEDINLAQLYNAIGSPAAGNWIEIHKDDIPF